MRVDEFYDIRMTVVSIANPIVANMNDPTSKNHPATALRALKGIARWKKSIPPNVASIRLAADILTITASPYRPPSVPAK